MTTKTTKPTPVAQAEKQASIPKRPIIEHANLLRTTLTATLRKTQGELQNADMALSLAAEERDDAIKLAHERYDAIREGLDAERDDITTAIDAIEAALAKLTVKPDNVVQMKEA